MLANDQKVSLTRGEILKAGDGGKVQFPSEERSYIPFGGPDGGMAAGWPCLSQIDQFNKPLMNSNARRNSSLKAGRAVTVHIWPERRERIWL